MLRAGAHDLGVLLPWGCLPTLRLCSAISLELVSSRCFACELYRMHINVFVYYQVTLKSQYISRTALMARLNLTGTL